MKKRLSLLIALGTLTGVIFAISLYFTVFQGATDFERITPKMADSFVDSIGVNVHMDNSFHTNSVDTILLPKLQESGIRHVREGLAWYEYLKLAMIKMSNQGINLNLLIQPYDNSTTTKLPDITKVQDNLKSHIDRGINVTSIENPNEYNHPKLVWGGSQPPSDWPKWLYDYTVSTYTKFKSDTKTSSLPILSPTIIAYGSADKLAATGDSRPYVDYANIHWYCHDYWEDISVPNVSNLCNLDSDLAEFGKPYTGKPIIITETGVASTKDLSIVTDPYLKARIVTDEVGGKYLTRRLFETFNRGVTRTYIYEFNVWPEFTPNQLSYYWALVNTDGTNKPAFTGITNMIKILNDPGNSFTPTALDVRLTGPTTLHKNLLQKRDGSYYLTLWNEVDSRTPYTAQSVQLELAKNFTAEIFKPLSSSNAISTLTSSNIHNISVGDEPLIIRLSNPSEITPPSDTSSPVTVVTSPTDNTVIKGTASVTATATDDVAVLKVVFYLNNAIVATALNDPYQFTLDTTKYADGTYTLKTIAYDTSGNTATSSPISVQILNASTVDTTAPIASIVSPLSGSSAKGNLKISAAATDNIAVTKIELYIDNVKTDTLTVTPYQFSWNVAKVTKGSHTIYVKAYDLAGNVGTSSVVTITVR